MKVALRDIDPNPFRHMEHYPVRRDKVETLKESIGTTTFWDNLVGRKVDGKVQIAYGHHRLVALRELFPGDHTVDLIIRDLDDTAMLKIMARENMDEWGTNAEVEHETVRAAVEAYAEGRIELPPLSADTPTATLRYAPHFRFGKDVSGARTERPYNATNVAAFLGWGETKVKDALQALALIEGDIVSDDVYRDLRAKQAETVTREAGQVMRRLGDTPTAKKKAGVVARAARDAMVKDDVGYRDVRSHVTDKLVPKAKPERRQDLDDAVMKLAADIGDYLDPQRDRKGEMLTEFAKHWEWVAPHARREMETTLRIVRDRVESYRAAIAATEDTGDVVAIGGGHS